MSGVWLAVILFVGTGFVGLGLYVLVGYARCWAARRRLGKPLPFVVLRDGERGKDRL